jgi:hypothetical protein
MYDNILLLLFIKIKYKKLKKLVNIDDKINNIIKYIIKRYYIIYCYSEEIIFRLCNNGYKVGYNNFRDKKNLYELCDIYDLKLEECNNILNIDLRLLKNVKNLIIYGCKNINNISELSRVKKLTINGYFKILEESGIEKLENVDELNFIFCNGNEIINSKIFKNLKNLKILNLSNTNINDVRNLSKLKNLRELYLEKCKNISDESGIDKLEYIHTLDLRDTNISDVSALGNVHILELSYTNINNVSMLENIYRLNLYGCENIDDNSGIDKLKNVYYLDIGLTEIKDINKILKLENVIELNLSNTLIYNPIIYDNIQNLEILKLNDCDCIEEITIRKDIKELSLDNCHNLKKILVYREIKKLSLHFCLNIEDIYIDIFGNIKILNLYEENNIEDKKMKELKRNIENIYITNVYTNY